MLKKPEWLKVSYSDDETASVRKLVKDYNLSTVCVEASCPNLGECYSNKTATFMIMGEVCTRNCGFCNVTCKKPLPLNEREPSLVAQAAKKMQLQHVVVTQVSRDDLKDGGAEHMALTIKALKEEIPTATIEVLTSDFQGRKASIDCVIEAGPDVFGHNIEMPKDLYPIAHQQADYQRSLDFLAYIKDKGNIILTKSGFMLGLGEREDQIRDLLKDLANVKVDILTIGQYLQPSENHVPLKAYISPDEFDTYKKWALDAGIPYVVASPFVRSSYKAQEALNALKNDL